MKQLGKFILWQRARNYLTKYHPTVIGVTGSSGKTIAKEAIAAVLSVNYRVRRSPFSYNTRLGIALSILGITAQAAKKSWYKLLTFSKLRELTTVEPDIIVLEIGADRPGDIDFLARQLPFKGAVVTNVQSAHLRLFIRQEMVAHEIKSLVTDIPTDGFTVLNLNDPLVADMSKASKAPVITYGQDNNADIRLVRAKRLNHIGFACEVNVAGKVYELHLPQVAAAYHLPHFLAALAVAQAMSIDIKKAISKLQAVAIPPGRMNVLAGYHNATLLDDSYNASPESTLASLSVLEEYPGKRKIAILGDMLDLGAHTITAHRQIGERVADVAQVLVCVGTNMRQAGATALEKSHHIDVHYFTDSRDVGKWLHDFLQPDDVVLIKGSRDMHMEEVTKRLLADPEQDSTQTIS